MDTHGEDFSAYEKEYESRLDWRRARNIVNLKELAEVAQTGGGDALEHLPKLGPFSADNDPKSALRISILYLWCEAAECYIYGEFQSCILTCGAVVERCLKLKYEEATNNLPGKGWTLGICINKCKGIVTEEVLYLARQILEPRNNRAHALLEHNNPQIAYLGGYERGIEIRSPYHHLFEPYRGDAKSVITVTFKILKHLFGP